MASIDEAPARRLCVKCSREIVPCEECRGEGMVDGEECEVCLGASEGCAVHHSEWQER